MFDFVEKRALVVGAGSAGCRIASQLQRYSILADHYAYVSCEPQDLTCARNGEQLLIDLGYQGKASTSRVRGEARRVEKEIKRLVSGSRLVFVITGLGGGVGSALSPMVAEYAREQGAKVVAFAALPYRYEKNRLFRASLGLKQLRSAADGVVMIDNNDFMQAEDVPISDVHAMINEKIAFSLNKMIVSSNGRDYPIGLNKFLGATSRDGYSVLSTGTSDLSSIDEAVAGAAKALYENVEPDETREALLYVVGDSTLTPRHIENSVGTLTSLIPNDTVEVHYGFSCHGTGPATAIIVASGFTKTKFDRYDPLAEILGDRVLDPDPEESIELGLDNIPVIEV